MRNCLCTLNSNDDYELLYLGSCEFVFFLLLQKTSFSKKKAMISTFYTPTLNKNNALDIISNNR